MSRSALISASICLLAVTASLQAVAQHAPLSPTEKQIVGTWAGPKGGAVTFRPDRTFEQGSGAMGASGKWAYANHQIKVTVLTIGGKSVDDFINRIKTMMAQKNPKAVTPEAIAKMRKSMTSIVLKLSLDGKSIVSAIPGVTPVSLTKQTKK